jgi:hypothetical protein
MKSPPTVIEYFSALNTLAKPYNVDTLKINKYYKLKLYTHILWEGLLCMYIRALFFILR